MYALDIETKCAVVGCTDKQCKHALIPHLSEITVIGVWNPDSSHVFRGTWMKDSFNSFVIGKKFILQNGKFDYKKLLYDGYNISPDSWVGDTQLMAYASVNKVPALFLEQYSAMRTEKNKELPRGFSHRDAGSLSLKVLAPYYLGVQPFWEDPTNHDSDAYVLNDCEYTYRLYEKLKASMADEDLRFYEERLMPWSKMLLEAEIRGIQIDTALLKKKKDAAQGEAERLKRELDVQWKDAHHAYQRKQVEEIRLRYEEMKKTAVLKAKDKGKAEARYTQLCLDAISKIDLQINLDSPVQLKWLLKDYLGLDVASMKEEDKESTGKDVLNRLYNETGREDLKTFLAYREQKKLLTAFFPSYEELMDHDGILRCSFNITGTRTGRLSSSSPNLQQVPADLHALFIARSGYNLVTRDMSYIEPRLIAYFTEDPFLCDLINREGDFHSYNTKIMFGLDCEESEVKDRYPRERKLAKTVGLALLYGAGSNRIFQTATQQGFDWNINQCREIYKNFREQYEHIYRWKEELDRTAHQRPIKNLFGFRRQYEPDDVHMQAFNGLIQGSASMMVVEAARKVQDLGYHVLLSVHDELVIEVPADDSGAEQKIEQVMTDFPLPTSYGNIPLKVEGKTSHCWSK